MMRVLVTGGNGFIGSFLVETLLQRGHQVRCLVRKTSNLRWLEGLDIELLYGSLHDTKSLYSAVAKTEIVYHLAGATKALDRGGYFRANTEGTKNLLDACRSAKPKPPKFVFVSSQAAAGPCADPRPKNEKDLPVPITAYGESKWEAEKLVKKYMEQVPATIVRPPAVYGPRDTDLLEFFRWVNRGICPLLGFKHRLASVVHIGDLVEGILLAGEKHEAIGNTYFICNDQAVGWETVGKLVGDALGKHPLKLRVPEFALVLVAILSEIGARFSKRPALLSLDKSKDMRQKYWVCDNTRAKNDLGFVQRMSLDEGIRQTADWYRQQGWL